MSREELSLAATAALLALDEAGRQRMLERLPSETAEVILPILETPRRGKSAPVMPKAGKAKVRETWQRLWAEWRSMVARESMNLERGDQDLQLEWVRLLAGATKTDMNAPAFLGAMRRWIARVDKASGGFEQCKGSLATLLLDLDSGQHLLKEQCPRLRRLLEREHRGGDALERSRRRRLQRLGGRVLLPEVMVLLKKHAATLVPDPAGDYGSNYDSCSEWMAAVHELSPEEAGKLLRRWQEVHHRRRNLWKALSSRGLSRPWR